MSINSQKKKSPGIRETIHSEESKFKEKGEKKKNFKVTVEGKISWQALLLGYAIVFKEKQLKSSQLRQKISSDRKLNICMLGTVMYWWRDGQNYLG